MASNVDIKLMAGLDVDSSVPQIKEDIALIQRKLEAAGIKINLVAEIDEQLKDSLKKLSGDKNVTTSAVQLGEKLAESLIDGYNIKSKEAQNQIKKLTRSIFQMSYEELKTGKDNPEFSNTFNQLGEAVKNNANIIKERMGIYDDFYEYFQGLSKIKIPDIVQKDLGKDWDSMRKVAAKKFVTNKNGIELDSIYQEMSDKYKDIFTGTTDPTEQFREIVNAIKAYRADIDKMEPVDPSKITGFEDNMWSDLLSDIGVMREKIKEQMPQIEEEVKGAEQYIKQLPADLDYLEEKFKGANIKMPDDLVHSFANIRKEIEEINNTQDPEQKIEAYNRLTDELNNVTEQYKKLSSAQKSAEKDSKLQSNKTLFNTNINTWMNKNTAAAKVFSDQLTDVKSKLNTADAVEFGNLKRQFQNIQAEAKQMGLTTSGAVKEIKEGFNSAITNVVSFTAAMSTFRKMVDTAKDIDDSMYNIQVVTGQTREEAKSLMNTYNQMAQDLGATTTQISSAADDWLRSGKSISETNTLIKDSLILAKIGMIDTATATKDLMSIMNGYQLDVSHAIEVMSKLGSIDQASASSAGGLAESLSRTASSAKQAGINLDMLLGMLATIKDTAPNIGDEQIGNSIKAIVARYSQIKVGKFEDYESGESLSNVEKALNKVGIKLRENLTDYRDLSDVLKELAGKYNTLNDVERNSINTALFGTYQANMGQILLSNWDKVEKLTEISEKSSTEALDKFNKYADSVTAHINSMKAAYEKLAMQLSDSEFLKGAADAGTGFLNVLSEIIDKLGVMSTAMGAVTAGAALKGHNIGVFDNNGTDITFLGKTLEEMKQASAEGQKFGGLFTSNVIQPITNAQSVIDNYNKMVANQCVNQDRINRLTDDLDMRKYLSGLNGAEAGMKGYTASLNMGTAATMGLKVATVALNMAFNMAVMAAVTASVSFLVNKYKELNPTVEEATSALEQNQSELKQHTDKVEELGAKLKETQDKLEELNNVGGIKSLTDQEEVDRLKNVTEELKTQLAVEKERIALKARDTLSSAEKAYHTYDPKYTDQGDEWKPQAVGAHGAYVPGSNGGKMSNSPVEELDNTIKAYEKAYEQLQQMQAEIDQASAEGNSSVVQKLTTDYQNKQQELVGIRQHAYDTYTIVNGVNSAFKDISKSGEALTTAEQSMFDETSRGINVYNDFLGTIQKTAVNVDDLTDKTDTYADEAEQAAQAQEDLNAALKKTPEGKQIAAINEMSTGFEKIDKIMKDVKDKGTFDYSNLADTNFTKAFSGMDSYDNFIKTISTYPSDLGKCQDAFNDLVTDFLNSSGIIDNLTDDTADLTTAMLSNMGVSNAEELVTEALAAKHAQLAAQKYIDANASNDLKDATLDEYVQFLNEASGSEVSKAALAQLELAKLAVNNVKIDTASDIEQVIALANTAGASAANLLELQRAESILGQVEAGTLDMDVPGNNMLLDYANNTKNKLNNNTFKFEYEELDPEKFKKAVYDGGVKTNTPSKGSSGSKGAKENSTIDWIKRSAELLERESTRLQTAIDDTWKAYTGLSQADIERVQELFSMNLTPNSDEVNELLDYADKLGVSIGELQDLANNNGLESRQSLLDQLIDVDKQRLDQGIDSLNYYKNSYEEYVAKVPEYRDKIENGGIDIESFSGDEKTKIENAMNAYDSYLNQKKTNLELSNTIRDNELKYYTIAIDEIDKKNARLSNSNDLIQKQIDLLNTQGVTVSSSMYDQLISNTEGQIGYQQEKLQKQKDQLIKAITEEGLKVGSDKWYELNDEIMSTEGSIKDLEKAQAEYEKQLRELPITNLEKLGTIYQNILDTIQNWGAEMEASGKTLNADYYQKLINNANTSISNYKEEIEAIQDVMEDYNPGTDNWNEMNDKLQQCNSSISSLVQNMHKWNEELLKLPIDKISDASDSLSKIVDGLNDVKSEHETVISAVTGAISDEIDRLNDEKEAYEDTINDQKEALQDRMDLLDKQNEKLKLQAQYEQALYDLENATTQKTEKVKLLPSFTVM